jgi:ferredoxin-NADP reductase
MPKYTTTLIGRFEAAERTMTFVFGRPENFNFIAGQYVIVILPNAPYNDEKGNRRTFTIASPPREAGRVQVTTRMTGSALKRSLAEVALGAPVELLGPTGTFILPAEASAPIVFIAGGIGITPFRSMALDAAARQLPHQITLIYSNRHLEGAAFHDELSRVTASNKNFTYIPTITQAGKSPRPWDGERRHVNAEFLRDHLRDPAKPIFYVAGPEGFVNAVTKAIIEAGGDASRIRAEEFTGY